MKKIVFLLLVFIIPIYIQSQCLCGFIEFEVKFKNLKFESGFSNYSIQIIKQKKINSNRKNIDSTKEIIIKQTSIDKEKYKFRVPTGNGIDSLKIVITNKTNDKKMFITTTHITYDNPYYINLLNFKKGNYLFDWKKISECQRKNQKDSLIICEGKRIIQLELKKEGGYFIHNKIKPKRIKDFSY